MRAHRPAYALLIALALLLAGTDAFSQPSHSIPDSASASPPYARWAAYGGDAGGARYADLGQITPENVHRLQPAWTYHTGELGEGSPVQEKLTFEATPILFEGILIFPTAFGEVVALDPGTGEERWRSASGTDRSKRYSELAARGVAAWHDESVPAGALCAHRIFFGTIDARLLAFDAATGRSCPDFGEAGTVDLKTGFAHDPEPAYVNYQMTSPPTVVGDIVVVGSSIGDNWNVDTGRGAVRGYDVRSGRLRWTWDPFVTTDSAGQRVGARPAGVANAWAPMASDPERELVFIPTGSPSPDFYGGLRPGDNADANAVVALRASTGKRVWAFQVVHHDLWDYDVASPPALVDLVRDGETVPALVQATKMGHVFVLHRETGEPLFPVEERPVPASDVPGEAASPTQPFPVLPAPLLPERITADDAWGVTAEDSAACRAQMEGLRHEGPFTPPSLEGTLIYPGNIGGSNWGGIAVDPGRALAFVPTNRLPTVVRLLPRKGEDGQATSTDSPSTGRQTTETAEYGAQRGAPYAMERSFPLAPSRIPCTAPPWSTLTAIDLGTGEARWRTPLGTLPGLEEGPGTTWGSLVLGGPVATGGGLVFSAGKLDGHLRAFSTETGTVLWEAPLPFAGIATPMTYEHEGRQFVVIAAGGHGKLGLPTGDALVAFALPR
ncbi:MAG: pyrroloquinoline quinone-dependent dehydrogenase [Rhodothermales bacterium]